MKISLTIAMAAAISVHAEVPRHAEEKAVVVYLENCISPKDQFVATSLADNMFAGARVRVVWRTATASAPDAARERPIFIHFNGSTPPTDHPGALAYALPFDGTRITIFYDRVKMGTPRTTQIVLAHVLVHEITHILQGVVRHSDTGVMKAHWSATDYSAMFWRPLPFARGDVELIQLGLAKRFDGL